MHVVDLDHAASTPLLPEAWEAMRPYALERAGNPASSHRLGRLARQGLEEARERIAACLDAEPDEVVFTSGATEANNLAILGLADAGTILVSPIEHPCVLEPIAKLGRPIVSLPVDASGIAILGERLGLSPPSSDLRTATTSPAGTSPAARSDLGLATLMLVNHETGAIQPVEGLVRQLDGRVPIHCDAAAAVGKIDVRFRNLGVSTLTASAHKFHGPKGVGVLLVRRGTRLGPRLFGGHQQQGRRPGTESACLAVGMATALERACRDREKNHDRVARLRARFLGELENGLGSLESRLQPVHSISSGDNPKAPAKAGTPTVNGDGVPHIVNVSFPGCRADALLMALDLAGVACSTGSACSSGSLLPSPVLRAMGVELPILESAMRFSFGPLTPESDIDLAARRIMLEIKRLRST